VSKTVIFNPLLYPFRLSLNASAVFKLDAKVDFTKPSISWWQAFLNNNYFIPKYCLSNSEIIYYKFRNFGRRCVSLSLNMMAEKENCHDEPSSNVLPCQAALSPAWREIEHPQYLDRMP
jgi:hypothetical protein